MLGLVSTAPPLPVPLSITKVHSDPFTPRDTRESPPASQKQRLLRARLIGVKGRIEPNLNVLPSSPIFVQCKAPRRA